MKINYLVYTSDLTKYPLVKKYKSSGIETISACDPRSALYIATGIAAKQNDCVLVIVNSSNESRSAFSGMTEAYYRNLPIILLTIGQHLDYNIEIADVAKTHYVIDNYQDLEELEFNQFPAHVELKDDSYTVKAKQSCHKLENCLSQTLNANHYLYFSNRIDTAGYDYQCKVVNGGLPNCYEGTIANVLGASLAKMHSRYIAVMTEKELMLDINTLGNINMNNSLLLFVLSNDEKDLIMNVPKSIDFKTYTIRENDLVKDFLVKVINNNRKSILRIIKES